MLRIQTNSYKGFNPAAVGIPEGGEDQFVYIASEKKITDRMGLYAKSGILDPGFNRMPEQSHL